MPLTDTTREEIARAIGRTMDPEDDIDILEALENGFDWITPEQAARMVNAATDAIEPIINRLIAEAEDRGVEAAAKALEADAQLCDCAAREEGECACGAWCEWKSITSARAVEIVRALKTKDAANG